MRILARLSSLWRTIVRKDALDRDLDEELRSAVATLAARHEAAGLSPHAAERAALAALGGPAGLLQVKAAVRDGRIGAGLDACLLDLRYAWRSLRNAPRLTAVIVATLALGIGANAAILSVVRAVLIEPLPYRQADRLVFVWLDQTAIGYPRGPLSGPDLGNLREGSRTVERFGAIWATGTVALTGEGDPEQLRSAFVTAGFFEVLGAEAALGRTFHEADSAPGAPPTILLGWEIFERRYGADATIVGRQIVVDDRPTTVIGVMPPAFRLLLPPDASVPDRLQVWQPFWDRLEHGPRGNLFLRVVGRMRPGVTVAEARADIDAIAARVTRELGVDRAFTTVALQADAVREVRGPLLVLLAGVGLLLTIACVNVAGLLVARAASRARETALRLALGASRRRVWRQSLVEGLLLTGLGAAAGVLAGQLGLRALLALAPASLDRIRTSELDGPVLAVTLAVAVVWGVLFSLAPTAELFRNGLGGVLHSTGRSTEPVRYRTRAALVGLQVALSLVLLIGAGLLVRAFVEVQRVDPGFRADRQLTFRVALPESRYRTTDAVLAAADELQRRLEALPGVTAAAAISHLPYDDLPNWGLTFAPDGTDRRQGAAKADTRSVSAGLFDVLGVRLVEGRFFTRDESRTEPVAIVDDRLARQLWPGRSALGQSFLLGQAAPDRRATVVGVVRHLRQRSLVDDLTPQIFLPYRLWQRSPMAYVVRTDRDLSALAGDVRGAVAAFDPRLPIYDVRPLAAYVEAARSIRRFTMQLAATFAAVALALTCLGVYGVLAYAVAVRRREIGVRRALGADTRQVMGEVLREGLGLALAGCAGGLGAAAIGATLLRHQLYAVPPHDPVTFGAALTLVLAGAVIACVIPAWRATAISPMDALRAE